MAELHDEICGLIRRKFVNAGFREAKSPMPTYRPDFFARRLQNGEIKEQVVIEVEIEKTVFSPHTWEQISLMREFISHQTRKRIKTLGILAIPKGPKAAKYARSLLLTMFPEGHPIELREIRR